MSVCRPVTSRLSAFSCWAHPSAVGTHKVSFQPRRYTSLQSSRPSACGITRPNPLRDLCCMLSSRFPSQSPLLSADITPAAVFKDVVRTWEYDAGRLKLATRLLQRNRKSTCDSVWLASLSHRPWELRFKSFWIDFRDAVKMTLKCFVSMNTWQYLLKNDLNHYKKKRYAPCSRTNCASQWDINNKLQAKQPTAKLQILSLVPLKVCRNYRQAFYLCRLVTSSQHGCYWLVLMTLATVKFCSSVPLNRDKWWAADNGESNSQENI